MKFKEELDEAVLEYTKSENTQSIDTNALKELKQLLDEGIITQEDFDKKKNKMNIKMISEICLIFLSIVELMNLCVRIYKIMPIKDPPIDEYILKTMYL